MENIITSKDNPTVKLYQKLSSSKKERLQYGLFVLEGQRIVEDALKEESGITQLILTQKAYERFGEELLQADLRNTRTIVISNELGNRIASTDSTQGVFAMCRIPVQRSVSSIITENGKYLVLFGLQDPGNVGMMIRTADALGISGVIMSGSCDLYSPKVIRSTMGSVFRMKIAIENDADKLFEELSGITTSAAVIDKDALPVTECTFEGAQAVFIGNEGNGLPADVAQRCSRKVIIPMHGNINSLNAAMAAGILMWELSR
ncbi:RNA methyltransferase, TrmH family [Ruminococcus flavefaciens]|uniref:RNA methyltransferase, TrmH family n=1 Tax=Ruminococcus flavefaciens TaxID=1265 RepID=A0A1H6I0W5_RUMFL|nr:RNA methyltransferase [Ruminococcus flavefaciens]SEH40119.1 RNA methyltransferase, TrmH family [Ruminococcus flavefaciens]